MATGGSRRLMKLAGIAITAAVLVGRPGTALAAPRTRTIIIDKMKFGAMPMNVRAGDIILWVNRDMFKHSATARDRSFNVDLAPSARRRTVLKRTGSFAFYCTYHPGMKGQLIVAGK